MTMPHPLPHLSDVASDYDILLCDVWGVIHNGRESWPAACEALTRFNDGHGHVVLISNSPRPSSDVVAQLDRLGVPRRTVPRTRVPARSVALAGEFTGVYPRESPGGWQLIGRSTLEPWDLERDPPALLVPGSRVRFVEER